MRAHTYSTRLLSKCSTSLLYVYYRFISAETAVNFYSNNRRQILDIATPIAEEIAAEFIIQFGNQILGAVLLDEVLPDN